MFLGGEKGRPNFGKVRGGDAGAVVANFKFDVVARGEPGNLFGGKGDVARENLDTRRVGRGRHRLEGVEDEIL